MSEAAERRAKVLVVDDNEQNRLLAEQTLEGEGHEPIVASSGAEALALFERDPPDCVLLDVRMPGMDGFAVCERIRALPGGADVPVVFLTALRDVETFDRAMLAGADDFLTKPVRPVELVVRVQAALKMRRLSAELRDHYTLIRHQRDDLVRLGLQKEMLTAFLVHDLKNPVSSMDVLAQVLSRNRALPEEARETAGQIRAGARQLMRMIHNLLDISKGEEGMLGVQRAEVDLRALLEEVRGELDATARDTQVTLEVVVTAPKVVADQDLIRRVLENLVENAVRHAPRRTVVRLSAERRGDAVELRVADRGPGIPAEMRERIFEKFVQLDRGAASRGGRGLGLTFCKLAVEAHGGRIWAEDGAPGTVMCVRIPDEP